MPRSTIWSRGSATVFKQLGLKQRDVVAALDTNSASLRGALLCGRQGRPDLPAAQLSRQGSRTRIHDQYRQGQSAAGRRSLSRPGRPHSRRSSIIIPEWSALGDWRRQACIRLADLRRQAPRPTRAEAEVEDEDVSVLMYTSGTTSLPKGVMLSFHDFTAYVTANVEMADGTDRGTCAGVRALLPYRRNHRDDDQHVDRPQNDRDAAVRGRRPGSNWSSRNTSPTPSWCPP